jgi:hypothetical protein
MQVGFSLRTLFDVQRATLRHHSSAVRVFRLVNAQI